MWQLIYILLLPPPLGLTHFTLGWPKECCLLLVLDVSCSTYLTNVNIVKQASCCYIQITSNNHQDSHQNICDSSLEWCWWWFQKKRWVGLTEAVFQCSHCGAFELTPTLSWDTPVHIVRNNCPRYDFIIMVLVIVNVCGFFPSPWYGSYSLHTHGQGRLAAKRVPRADPWKTIVNLIRVIARLGQEGGRW